MKKSTLRYLLITCIVGVTILLLAGATGYFLFFAPTFHPDQKSAIYIDRDDTADSIIYKVRIHGNPSRLTGLQLLAKWRNPDNHLHTGRYLIHPKDNAYQLFNRICRGHQEPVNLTVGSTRTVGQLIRQISRQLMIDSTEIASQITDTLFLSQNGYSLETLPCLFIPNTYQVYWNISASKLAERLIKEHRRFWNQQRLEKAKAIGLTPKEVATLASIVEEETNHNEEKKVVAGLYLNRLHRGIPLQADPTVKFALQAFDLRRITNAHLQNDSPYNTYKNQGLPPGPIRIPSPIGLDAVLNYTRHNYLYMCAKEDFSGTHHFAATLSEHNANARRYHQALNQRKIYK